MHTLLNSFIKCHLLKIKIPPRVEICHGGIYYVYHFMYLSYHMEIIFCALLWQKVSEFLSVLSRHSWICMIFMMAHLLKHMHQWASSPPLLHSWLLRDKGFHPAAVFFFESLHFTLSLGRVLATLSSLLNPIGSMPSVLISMKITPGMAVWLDDEAKWNANLGLVSDNNKCGAVAFISISSFHLEIGLGFGNTFISELRLLNQPWWLSQQSCAKEP